MSDIFIGIDGTTPDQNNNVRFDKWDFAHSFIYMMYKYSSAQTGDKIHIAGPDLWGVGTSQCVEQALDFLSSRLKGRQPRPRIIVAGYSRGAYAALRVAQAIGLAKGQVAFLGLLDIVKCTDDNTEIRIGELLKSFSGEKSAVSQLPPMRGYPTSGQASVAMSAADKDLRRDMELSYSINRGSMPNVLSAGQGSFAIPSCVLSGFHARRDARVGSRTYPMGHYPISDGDKIVERRDFWCTHSAMGGMPFRGDILNTITRTSEWKGSRDVAQFIVKNGNDHAIFSQSPHHPVLQSPEPLASWYTNENIRSQYREYLCQFGSDKGGFDQAFESSVLVSKPETKAQSDAINRAMMNSRGRI